MIQKNEKHEVSNVIIVGGNSSYKSSLIKLIEKLPEEPSKEVKDFISSALKPLNNFDESISLRSNLINLVKSFDEEQCKLFSQIIGLTYQHGTKKKPNQKRFGLS